ncbi:MAG: hypothetical protein WA160_04060 [Pseudobdellovibrio sp.]
MKRITVFAMALLMTGSTFANDEDMDNQVRGMVDGTATAAILRTLVSTVKASCDESIVKDITVQFESGIADINIMTMGIYKLIITDQIKASAMKKAVQDVMQGYDYKQAIIDNGVGLKFKKDAVEACLTLLENTYK